MQFHDGAAAGCGDGYGEALFPDGKYTGQCHRRKREGRGKAAQAHNAERSLRRRIFQLFHRKPRRCRGGAAGKGEVRHRQEGQPIPRPRPSYHQRYSGGAGWDGGYLFFRRYLFRHGVDTGRKSVMPDGERAAEKG